MNALAPAFNPDALCPCGSGKSFGTCCGPLLGGAPAPDARALMRSRYTAFALKDADYLLRSWHTSTRPETIEFDDTVWKSLKIRAYMPLSEQRARVQFVAKGIDAGGRSFSLKEDSRFVKENGHWYYVDGKFT